MKSHLLFTFIFLTFFGLKGKATEDFTYLKIAVDAMAVNNALFSVSSDGTNQKAKIYYTKLDGLLDDLATHQTGFRKDMFPAKLYVKAENTEHIKLICSKLTQTMQEIRQFAKAAESQFDLDDLSLIMTLKSENPGDYYMGINPDFIYSLSNHPYRKSIEELQLQDIGFADVMASGDTSLWNMGTHCPNLKILTIFAAEINNQILVNLKLNQIKNLKALELSENLLTDLPADFNAGNTLIYLSLQRNKFKKLPNSLRNWTNLVYLNLGGNQLNETERKRIQQALPKTKIIF